MVGALLKDLGEGVRLAGCVLRAMVAKSIVESTSCSLKISLV